MRKQKVRETAQKIIRDGRKPSALSISEKLGYTLPDTHRCLNALEKDGSIATYRKSVLGNDYRMVAVNRD